MPTESNRHFLLNGTIRAFRSSWKSLVLTDIAFKVLAFIVLTPLVGVLFRTLIAISGNAVVSDLDILFFFLGPAGWICGIVVGALWLAIVALEQASLMGIICAESVHKSLGPIAAIRFAAGHTWPLIRVTIRIIALTLLAIAPFLAVAGAVYFALLTEYDINYYLQEKPPEFLVAVGIGAVIAAALVALLLRLFTSWGKIRVNIELKYYGHDEQLEQRVADLVEARDMAADVVAMSLKMDGVRKMKSIRPDWKVGLLMSVSAGNLKKIEADFLAVNAGFANRRLIRTARDSGREVYVWTVNDAPTMSAMISRGVDGLLTDKPALARSVLQQRARMSAPERLLLQLAGILGSVPEIGEQ